MGLASHCIKAYLLEFARFLTIYDLSSLFVEAIHELPLQIGTDHCLCTLFSPLSIIELTHFLEILHS